MPKATTRNGDKKNSYPCPISWCSRVLTCSRGVTQHLNRIHIRRDESPDIDESPDVDESPDMNVDTEIPNLMPDWDDDDAEYMEDAGCMENEDYEEVLNKGPEREYHPHLTGAYKLSLVPQSDTNLAL